MIYDGFHRLGIQKFQNGCSIMGKKNMEKTIEMADLEGPPCVWKHIETSRNGSVWPGQREECWEQATTLLEAGNVN